MEQQARALLSELLLEQRKQLQAGALPHSDPHKLKQLAELLTELIKPFKPNELLPPVLKFVTS